MSVLIRKSDGARLRGRFDGDLMTLPYVRLTGAAPRGYSFGHTAAYLERPEASERAVDVLRQAEREARAAHYAVRVDGAPVALELLAGEARYASRRAAVGAMMRAATNWRHSQSRRTALRRGPELVALRDRRSHRRTATVATLEIVDTLPAAAR